MFVIVISPGFALTAGTPTRVLVYLSSFLIPTVLLLGARVAASAAVISPNAEKKAWLILAWVSTVAGNLSLQGSASNLIVCEQARLSQFGGYTLTFWRHLKFGVPSTLIVTAVGLALSSGFWLFFPAVLFLPIGRNCRTADSLLGAMLMVIFRVMTSAKHMWPIDQSILGLLFRTMLVSVYLDEADMFKYLGKMLSWKSQVCNDLMEFVLKIARQNNVPLHPYLLALASSADTGSSTTPIGNPRNLVIVIHSGISAGQFLLGLVPAMLVGNVVTSLILLCMYWKVLSVRKKLKKMLPRDAFKEVANGDDDLSQPGRKMLIQVGLQMMDYIGHFLLVVLDFKESYHWIEEDVCLSCYHRNADYFSSAELSLIGSRKTCVYLVTIGMLITFLLQHFLLVVLDFKESFYWIEEDVCLFCYHRNADYFSSAELSLVAVDFKESYYWTAGSLLGAVLMVVFRILTPKQAYDAIDLPILGLLFGTMVVSVDLERADMFKYLGKLLSWKCRGTKDLLCRICFISAISSSLFTNDTSCIVLTEFVLKIARQNKVPSLPFLLALASSANIGSSVTPIGNPQNLVIASLSGISFGEFVAGVIPAMLVGVVLNALILLVMYWKVLSVEKDEEKGSAEAHQFLPVTMSHLASLDSQGLNPTAGAIDQLRNRTSSSEDAIPVQSMMEEEGVLANGGNRLLRKMCVYLVTVGMLAGFLVGLNLSWTAVTAALVLIY
ncbi:hypothetical protein RHSIM_RhsimUnG0159600 [Rhododendron simsii]|uniref:Citrate transporter-like domain-containing protein n=1 Tax=Rhododendron simsii TaxID=118357 RepID=A0A834FVG3_RHOSS|nr:hypothetical protein RHSIM_RhsimUnG0159600 [Rhododendron simsii]